MATGLFDVLSIQGVTLLSTNISSEATVGFEAKDGRSTAYIHLTEATFETNAYMSFALGTGAKTVTAAQAKTLPGVTASGFIRVFAELYADSISGSRNAALEVEFFNESGTKQGDTTAIEVDAAGEWQGKAQRIAVPSGATRVNVYLRAGCDSGETVQVWIANLKIVQL